MNTGEKLKRNELVKAQNKKQTQGFQENDVLTDSDK